MGKDYKYILKGKKAVVEPNILKWARWMEKESRRVAFDTAPDDIKISTVFLGIDHGMGMSKKPILFETLVFRPLPDGFMEDLDGERYHTWEEAKRGHDKFVMKYHKSEAVDAEIVEEKNEKLTNKKRKN